MISLGKWAKKMLSMLLAQINPCVGAIEKNANKIIDIILANQQQYDFIIFPELALCGYPPEDLLFRKGFSNVPQIGLLKHDFF